MSLQYGIAEAPGDHTYMDLRRALNKQQIVLEKNELRLGAKMPYVPEEFMEKPERFPLDRVLSSPNGRLAFIHERGVVMALAVIAYSSVDNVGHINYFVVNKLYRRQGLGEDLMRFVLSHFKKMGKNEVQIGVLDNNKEAKKLYAKMGFTPYHVQMGMKLK